MAPFQRTTDKGTKFAPFTVSVIPADPIAALFGLMEVIEGTGNEVFPIPAKLTMWGPLGEPSGIVKIPDRMPSVVGVKVTVMVQVPSAPIMEPQLFVWAKSPVVLMPATEIGELLLFVRVSIREGLIVPTA